jgi:protein TonB
MFDTVLGRGKAPPQQLGKGAAISVSLHVALIVGVVAISGYNPMDDDDEDDYEVVALFGASLPPPPPPPPPKRKAAPKMESKIVKKTDVIQQPKTIPIEKPIEVEPAPDQPNAGGEDEGDDYGIEGGEGIGRLVDPFGDMMKKAPGQIGSESIPFGEGMTTPHRMEGADPSYTREALEARVEGKMIVKCVINTQGRLENCRVIVPLAHMEQAVLSAMETWKYTPVTFQGRAVNVDYLFTIKMVLPR